LPQCIILGNVGPLAADEAAPSSCGRHQRQLLLHHWQEREQMYDQDRVEIVNGGHGGRRKIDGDRAAAGANTARSQTIYSY
jgi:hypothetical protein